jgi:hypothetical protein
MIPIKFPLICLNFHSFLSKLLNYDNTPFPQLEKKLTNFHNGSKEPTRITMVQQRFRSMLQLLLIK